MTASPKDGFVEIASGGIVNADDKCGNCGTPMYYHVNETGRAYEMFCPKPECPAWLAEVWAVVAIAGPAALGAVKWFGRWRRYAFFPDQATVYEPTCLRDIAAFCDEQTKAHSERKA